MWIIVFYMNSSDNDFLISTLKIRILLQEEMSSFSLFPLRKDRTKTGCQLVLMKPAKDNT